jgi:cytochrome c oxidase subunit IV
VLIVLAVLEWYIMVAGTPGLLWWLIVIQLVEAGMIVYYFMHVAQLWRGDQHAPSDH